MNGHLAIASICSMVLAATPIRAQAIPGGDESKLGAALKRIEDELGTIGRISYTIYLHDNKTGSNWKDQGNVFEISRVRAEGCRVAFHSYFAVGSAVIGPPSRENDRSFSLLEVGDVMVTSADSDLNAQQRAGSHPEYENHVDPPIYEMIVRSTDGKTVQVFRSYDENRASRTANAINEGAATCVANRKAEFEELDAESFVARPSILEAGDLNAVTRTKPQAIVRIKLAILEPPIRSRISGLKAIVVTSPESRNYSCPPVPGFRCAPSRAPLGEKVIIRLKQGDRTLAEGSWMTSFPGSIDSSTPELIGAEVAGEHLLTSLLQSSVFNAADLIELARSPIPELRISAAANLSDQNELAKLAADDNVSLVRQAAVRRITDQNVLAKIAAGDKDTEVRKVALECLSFAKKADVENLADQGQLARIATEDPNASLRQSATRKLTDQAVLAKVASDDRDWHVRLAAVEGITDQAVLARITNRDSSAQVRWAASDKLTDQSVLAKVVVEDLDLLVRLHVVQKLTDRTVLSKVAVEDVDKRVRDAAVKRLDTCCR